MTEAHRLFYRNARSGAHASGQQVERAAVRSRKAQEREGRRSWPNGDPVL